MKTIDNLWNRVKSAHKDAVAQVNRYYAHGPSRDVVEFITQEVPMFYSSYFARFATSLAFPDSMEETNS